MAMMVYPLSSLFHQLPIHSIQSKLLTDIRVSRFPSPNSRTSKFAVLAATEKEQSHFDFDPERAREALRKLDEQLFINSKKETPKKRDISYMKSDRKRDLIAAGLGAEDIPQFSGSYLAYSAVALLFLTLFNNIVFSLIIKPSVDINVQTSAMPDRANRASGDQAPPLKDQS